MTTMETSTPKQTADLNTLRDNLARYDKLSPTYRALFNRARRNGYYHIADQMILVCMDQVSDNLNAILPLLAKPNPEADELYDQWYSRLNTLKNLRKLAFNRPEWIQPKNKYVDLFHQVAREYRLDKPAYTALNAVYRACCSPTNGERGDVVILYPPGKNNKREYEVTVYRECYRHNPRPDLFQRRYTLPAVNGIKALLYETTRVNNWFGSAWKERESALD